MPKKISGNSGSDSELLKKLSGIDPNHNEEFNSEELLMKGFFERMGDKLPVDNSSDEENSEDFKLTSPSDAIAHMRNKKSLNDGVNSKKEILNVDNKKIESILSNVKNDAIEIFQSSSESDQKILQRMIRGVEKIQGMFGINFVTFEKEKYLSGLSSQMDLLTNANLAMINTVDKYKLHILNTILSKVNDDKPCIEAIFLGEDEGEGKGFVAKVIVTAKSDFNGNEAIDFVDESGGLFTVKALKAGKWINVSDNFIIEGKTSSYDLEKSPSKDFKYSIFVGEKIAVQAKDVILSNLNLNNDDVIFGKYQVFSRDSANADRIRELIRVKSRK